MLFSIFQNGSACWNNYKNIKFIFLECETYHEPEEDIEGLFFSERPTFSSGDVFKNYVETGVRSEWVK